MTYRSYHWAYERYEQENWYEAGKNTTMLLTGTLGGGTHTGIFDVNIDPVWSITDGTGSHTDNIFNYHWYVIDVNHPFHGYNVGGPGAETTIGLFSDNIDHRYGEIWGSLALPFQVRY